MSEFDPPGAADEEAGENGDAPALDALASVATRAAEAGGDFLLSEFRGGPIEAEYSVDDVKATVDRGAESRVRAVIREAYPEHAFHGEESGLLGESEYVWVVDPLDGTNNFASGIPAFATAVAVLRAGTPLVGVVYEPLPDSLYVATRGEGATVNGTPIHAGSDVALEHGTVSFVVGLDAVRDETLAAEATALHERLRPHCRRVLQTWAPTVDWGLLARGAIEAIVCFHPDVYEQYAGELLAAESGVAAHRDDDLYVGAGDVETLDRLRRVLDG